MLHTKFREKSARRFWRRRFLKGFYHIWAWRPSWSCDPDAANKLSFPLPKEPPHKNLVLIGQAVSEKKMFEHCGRRRRRTDDVRRTTYDGRRTMGIL